MRAASSPGTARRRGWCRTTPPPAATTATAPASRWTANTGSPRRRATSSATRPSSCTRRLCRRYPPETVEAICWIPRAQVEEAARLHLARAPGVLLRLQRPRAPRQRHADGARDVAALCPHRLVRPARRQCAVRGAAGRADRRPRAARGTADGPDGGPRRAPARAGALGLRHHPRSLPGDSGGDAVPRPRRDRLRREHAAGPCRRPTRARGAQGAGLLRPLPICS